MCKKPHRWFRLIALLLCLTLLLTGCSVTELIGRTDGKTDTGYSGVHWDELKRSEIDEESFLARVEQADALLAQTGVWDQIWLAYTDLSGELLEYLTQYTLAEIDYYADCSDSTLQQRSNRMHSACVNCSDAFSSWLAAILDSAYRQHYIDAVGQENALQYEDYCALTPEKKKLIDREDELVSQYMEIATANESADFATLAQQVEPIYLELVQTRNQLAQSYGYDNYIAYSYEVEYLRSYTPAEICDLEETVKSVFAPVYTDYLLYSPASASNAPYRRNEKSSEQLLSVLRRYFSRMDSQLVGTLDTVQQSGFYDIDYRDSKFDACFTLMVNGVGLPFMFVQPSQDSRFYTLNSLVHELGHCNQFLTNPTYQQTDYYLYRLTDIDTAEIASNGLELLFSRYYPEIFGSQDAAELQQIVLSEQLSGIVYGCIMDEFQQKVYARAELQPGQVSEIFYAVMTDYFGDIINEDYAYYWWADVNHNFEAPFYYISYAVSALAVLQLWQTAQTDPDAALQTYLQLVSCGESADFIQLTRDYGLHSIFEQAFLYDLSDQLENALA